MTIDKTLLCAVLGAAVAAAGSAAAGPIGEGRHFTVETAQKHVASRTVKVAGASGSCLSQAAESLEARQDVEKATVRAGEIHVTFRTTAHAAAGAADIRSVVSKACA